MRIALFSLCLVALIVSIAKGNNDGIVAKEPNQDVPMGQVMEAIVPGAVDAQLKSNKLLQLGHKLKLIGAKSGGEKSTIKMLENGEVPPEEAAKIEAKVYDQVTCKMGKLEIGVKSAEDLQKPSLLAELARAVARRLDCDQTNKPALCERALELLDRIAVDIHAANSMAEIHHSTLDAFHTEFKAIVLESTQGHKGMRVRRSKRGFWGKFFSWWWLKSMKWAIGDSWYNAEYDGNYWPFVGRLLGGLVGFSWLLPTEIAGKIVIGIIAGVVVLVVAVILRVVELVCCIICP